VNQDLLIPARIAAHKAAHDTASAVLAAPITANHAVKVFLMGKAQVFEAALQAVRKATSTYREPLHPAMVRLAEQAARSVRWLE